MCPWVRKDVSKVVSCGKMAVKKNPKSPSNPKWDAQLHRVWLRLSFSQTIKLSQTLETCTFYQIFLKYNLRESECLT